MMDLDVDPHLRWLPLDFGEDVEERVAERVRARAHPEATEQELADTTAVLTGLARRTGEDAERLFAQGIGTLAAWTLLPGTGVLAPGPLATLRIAEAEGRTALDDLAMTLVAPEEERFGTLEVDELTTASGPALAVRQRLRVQEEGLDVAHEQRFVVWALPADDAVLFLSCYCVDLMAGAAVAEPLAELARGVRVTST